MTLNSSLLKNDRNRKESKMSSSRRRGLSVIRQNVTQTNSVSCFFNVLLYVRGNTSFCKVLFCLVSFGWMLRSRRREKEVWLRLIFRCLGTKASKYFLLSFTLFRSKLGCFFTDSISSLSCVLRPGTGEDPFLGRFLPCLWLLDQNGSGLQRRSL
jgi:hypothetical protein